LDFITSFNINYHKLHAESECIISPGKDFEIKKSKLKFFDKEIKKMLKEEEEHVAKRSDKH